MISFILVTTLGGSHYYNPHFTDEDALALRLSHLLKATQLVKSWHANKILGQGVTPTTPTSRVGGPLL